MTAKARGGKGRLIATALTLVCFTAVLAIAIIIAYTPGGNADYARSSYSSVSQEVDDGDSAEPDSAAPGDSGFAERQSEPITPEEAYAHAKILSTISAQSSSDNLTEAQATSFFKDRGFDGASITASYESDGTYCGELVIDPASSISHPTYETTYVANDKDIWLLYLYNGKIMANPVFYNFDNNQVSVLLSETESMTSYYSVSNTFYEIIPDGTTSNVKKVDRIDTDMLDSLTARKIDEL